MRTMKGIIIFVDIIVGKANIYVCRCTFGPIRIELMYLRANGVQIGNNRRTLDQNYSIDGKNNKDEFASISVANEPAMEEDLITYLGVEGPCNLKTTLRFDLYYFSIVVRL